MKFANYINLFSYFVLITFYFFRFIEEDLIFISFIALLFLGAIQLSIALYISFKFTREESINTEVNKLINYYWKGVALFFLVTIGFIALNFSNSITIKLFFPNIPILLGGFLVYLTNKFKNIS